MQVEEQLMVFRSSHKTAVKQVEQTLRQWDTLIQSLVIAQTNNVAANCFVDYSPGLEIVKGKQKQLSEERDKMERFCQERELRWTLCLQRNQLLLNMEEVRDQWRRGFRML